MFSSSFPVKILFQTKHFQIFTLFISLLITLSCSSGRKIQRYESIKFLDDRIIRVKLYESVSIKIELSRANLFDATGKKVTSFNNNSAKFSINKNEIKCQSNNNYFFSKEFSIVPINGQNLSFNGNNYRGYFKVVLNSSQLFLINYVDIEDYVKGVILKEMPLGDDQKNFEALKAFAILSRTYALEKKNNSSEKFDSHADTRDQVYGGLSAENEITNKLVDLTKGQVLFFDKEMAKVFYHSTCGGYTENVENVFKSKPLPYLISLRDGIKTNCLISPRFNWDESFSEKLIIKRLIDSKYISNKNSKFKEIKVKSRYKSGRVNELKIIVQENKELKEISLFSNNIRYVLRNSNGSILPSTNFEIEIDSNNTVTFKGKGFGHGVGMCQWGSISLSQNGLTFNEIINYYFPKTEIKKLYD